MQLDDEQFASLDAEDQEADFDEGKLCLSGQDFVDYLNKDDGHNQTGQVKSRYLRKDLRKDLRNAETYSSEEWCFASTLCLSRFSSNMVAKMHRPRYQKTPGI